MDCFKHSANRGKIERRRSLGEIKCGEEEEWSVDMLELLIGYKFDLGRHSQIYYGFYKQMEVAIKMISLPEENDALATALEQQFNSEFFAACKKPPVFCIVMEYMAGGSLRKHLHMQQPYSLPLELVLKLATEIAYGMNYLHSEGILHRDLKSENILLGEDMSVRVADFGISCLESECISGKGFTNTYSWMAPDMIKEKHHTRKVDVYNFVIVLWELVTALIPFHDMTPEQAAYTVSNKNARPLLPESCPEAFSHLINQCWATNPDKRPQFDEIVYILEGYRESLDEDPSFFSSYKPVQQPVRRGCFPCALSDLHLFKYSTLIFKSSP